MSCDPKCFTQVLVWDGGSKILLSNLSIGTLVHIVCVECANAVVLGGDDCDGFLRSIGAFGIGNDQLSIDIAIHDAIRKFTEGFLLDVGNSELDFLEICART